MVMIRSSSGMKLESTFRNVVLPDPVPPVTSMFNRARTHSPRNSPISGEIVPRPIRSGMVSRRWANLRIVIAGPFSESGGMMAFTRDPSGSRASTIADDSSTRRPTWATILSRIRRRCPSLANCTSVGKIRPPRSMNISRWLFTMISVTVSSFRNREIGP